MKKLTIVGFMTFLFVSVLFAQEVDRTVLPVKMPPPPQFTEQDAHNTQPPTPYTFGAPKDAPNVIIIMIDDLGFGGTSYFGGVMPTPSFDKLAETGLAFNHFHSTALCSPTRQALKTGRNHHSAAMGKITEVATSYPGYTGMLPDDVASIGTMLSLNGYSTGAFGKWHETAVWEVSPSGPMTRWPNYQGFDEFYGFIGGETNQWEPAVYHNMNRVETANDGVYHFMNDMTTKSIEWMRFQQALTPDKPFFMYFTPGAVHAPHHVPQSYIDKFKGQFDEGWDVIRERIYKNQLAKGVIPAGTKLADKPDDIKDWVDLSDNERKLFARQAEVFAAFLSMTDTEIGRLLEAVRDIGEMDNTLIFFIAGDNGTSAEGVMNGLYNEMTYFNNEPKGSDVDFMLNYYDEWGSPTTYPHMAAGWAVCFDAPFTWTKQVASNYGGTRQGLIVHWPDGIKAQGEMRTQWHHVIDVVPTILEAAKLPQPRVVNGIPQKPIEGVSMLYTFDNEKAADRHTTQYFEMFGNRAIYFDGWYAGTIHSAPWGSPDHLVKDDVWELYNAKEDYSLADDLAAQHPEKLAEMQDRWLTEALKYNVLPMDDRRQELFDPNVAGRPDIMFGRTELTLYSGMGGLLENDFINTKSTSFDIVADIETKDSKTNGVIIQQGGRFGGWSFYAKDNKLIYAYNYLGLKVFSAISDTKIPSGKSTVKMEFVYDDKTKMGAGGDATIYINDKKVGSARVEKTEFSVFSADETANVGLDMESMTVTDYNTETSKFTGTVEKVTISLK